MNPPAVMLPGTSGEFCFAMITTQQNRAVVRWLRVNARSKVLAPEVWAVILESMDRTGRVTLRTQETADEVGCTREEVTRVRADLVRAGALERRHTDGRTEFFLNPNIATHLPKAARKEAQEAAPKVPLLPLPANTGRGFLAPSGPANPPAAAA